MTWRRVDGVGSLIRLAARVHGEVVLDVERYVVRRGVVGIGGGATRPAGVLFGTARAGRSGKCEANRQEDGQNNISRRIHSGFPIASL
jgi:hypothetical protein